VIYLDSSAVVKLVRYEAETDALRSWLAANERPLASSALVRAEAARALARSEPAALPSLPAVLASLYQRPVSEAILDSAGRLPGANIRSLDAIHLATADALRPVLTSFIAYDKRLRDAAWLLGLPVVTPSVAAS
jgi:predicted nucleic acid-binding protein